MLCFPCTFCFPFFLVIVRLSKYFRHLFGTVFYSIQIVGDPFIYNIIIELSINQDSVILIRHRRCDMWSLVKDQFYRLPRLFECGMHHFELLCRYIFIIESMYDQCAALDPVCMQTIISGSPKFRIIIKSTF